MASIMKWIYTRRQALERSSLSRWLASVDPEALRRSGEQRLLAAFHRAAENSPRYRSLLDDRGIDPARICDVGALKSQVPILNKEALFEQGALSQLFMGSTADIGIMTASSGSSQHFSFGLSKQKEARRSVREVDLMLDLNFHTGSKRTCILNSLPMSVPVPASLPQAATGPNSASLLALLKELGNMFDQFIIFADPYFAKKLIEDGLDQGFDWRRHRIHMVVGGDWMPEGLRTYLSDLLGHDACEPQDGCIRMTMGMTELGSARMNETHCAAGIRKLLHQNVEFREALLGHRANFAPEFFQYNPLELTIEVSDDLNRRTPQRLVYSTTSPRCIMPLIRYDSGDLGQLLSVSHINNVLARFGLAQYAPRWRLPFVAMWGRADRGVRVEGQLISPNCVRAGLFTAKQVAAVTNGQFWMRSHERGDRLILDVRMRQSRSPTRALTQMAENHLTRTTGVTCEVGWSCIPNQPGCCVDYNRKFSHLVKDEGSVVSAREATKTGSECAPAINAHNPFSLHSE